MITIAESIYLNDGSVEYIFSEGDKKKVLGKLIHDRIGFDVMKLFYSMFDDYDDKVFDCTSELHDMANALDNYRSGLFDAMHALDDVLSAKRIDREELRRIRNNIYNSL